MKIFKGVVVIIMAGMFFWAGNAFAFKIQIDKAKTRIKLPPGWSDGGVINVENQADESIDVRVYLQDWEYSAPDGSKGFYVPGTSTMSASDWIKFYPADFTIPPKAKRKVNYVVAVPPDAVGGHYAVLFFEVAGGEILDENTGEMGKVYHRLGSLFYIEPDGTIERKAELSNFKIASADGAIKLGVTFKNSGNVDITTSGTFDIITEDGIIVTRGNFEEVYIMPGRETSISASGFGSNFAGGTCDVILTFNLGDGKILVGEWSVKFDSSEQVVSIKEME